MVQRDVPGKDPGKKKDAGAAADQGISLSDQRKFVVAHELIMWRAKREIIERECLRWSSQLSAVKNQIDCLEEEMRNLNEGQMVMEV